MMAEDQMTDVKENLQEVGDRIKNAMSNVQIPVRMYQDRTTAERRSGYYIEQLGLERFMDFVVRYYTTKGMGSTEPYQHLSAVLQTMIQLRDQTANDLEKIYTLTDQLLLLFERERDEAIREAVDRALKRAADPGPQPQFEVRDLQPGQDPQLGLEIPRPAAPAAAPAAAPVPGVKRPRSPEMLAMDAEFAAVKKEAAEIRAQIQARVDQPAPSGRVPDELPELDAPRPDPKARPKGGMSVPDDAEEDDPDSDDGDLDDADDGPEN